MEDEIKKNKGCSQAEHAVCTLGQSSGASSTANLEVGDSESLERWALTIPPDFPALF